jgi:exopolyphosphatase/guanosine-5'-triphosphate,3'-diphosphate pyrophosphatase
MRIAAIDIGTNSIHMILVQVRPDLSFELIGSENAMVRLGAGGLNGRALTDEAMTSALAVLSTFRRLARSHGVDVIRTAATSAVREAENGGAFLARIERETGIRVRVISGAKEASLIHQAAAYGVDLGDQRAVVIDIGGGRVEITLGSATEIQLARSFKLGVIRLTERFVRTDPLSSAVERRLVKHVTNELGAFCAQVAALGFDRVVGTSGTILSLGTMAAAAERGTVPAELRNLRVSAKSLHRLRKEAVALDLEDRLQLPGLDPRRADLMVAGAVLLDTILRRLGATELTLCDLALREGLVLDYIRRHRRQIAHIDEFPDVRRRSAVELAERCNANPEHLAQVAKLALALFDQTRKLHGLGEREREWLEYAGLLHDVGVHISYAGHHRHSYYLIKNGDLRGFEPDEIDVIALVARYHRRGTPKKAHDEYAKLSAPLRIAVRRLSSLLRVAESLDRSHAQVVSALEVRRRTRELLVTIHASSDVELELWAADRHSAPLAGMAGVPVRFEAAARRHARRAPARRRSGARPRAARRSVRQSAR